MLRVYAYKNCDTCRKAVRWLKENDIPHEVLPIRETPPQPAELRQALAAADGDMRRLFNTSGRDYRELGLKDRLPRMNKDEAIGLLSANGNLVKRPLALDADDLALIGFKEDEWRQALL